MGAGQVSTHEERMEARVEYLSDRLVDVEAAQPAAIADELERQARFIRRRITTHGLGPHGGCRKCEAWREVAAHLEARAAELRAV